MEFLKKLFKKGEEQNQSEVDPSASERDEQDEGENEVTTGTKVKVVAALLIVGFAAYLAYWIQEPVEVRTDLFGSSSMQDTQAMSGTEAMSQMQAGETQQVSIQNYSYNPATLNVTPGTTVVWTNNDAVPQNVVGDNFASPTLNQGDTYSYTFNDSGSFTYNSSFYPQMKGYLIVGTPSSETQPNDVLSGFGAGSSFTTGTETANIQNQAVTQEAASAPAETQNQTPAEQTPPEQLFINTAPAPGTDQLHGAAQSLSASLSDIGNVAPATTNTAPSSAEGSTALSAAEQQNMVAAQNGQNAQVEMPTKGKLASSGPEDYVYAGMFALTLFLNRRKLYKIKKSLR